MKFPDFYELAPVVPTRDAFAATLGAAQDGLLEYNYVDAVRLAGHSCPTVAGAFLIGRAALAALYPEGPAERGAISVHMPAPEDEGTTGVIAQVLTLLTGAAADNGFHGIQGRFRRKGLLSFADSREGRRSSSNASTPAQQWRWNSMFRWYRGTRPRGRLMAILQDRADASQREAFANAWQARVRRLLLEFADDPRVIHVTPVSA